MNTRSDKKLFIIRPPGYEYEKFEPLLSNIESHFDRILSLLKVSTPSNDPVQIKLNIDVFNPEKTSAYAKRVSKRPAVYEVRLNAGLSYYLWTASRSFSIPEYNILPWVEECTINDERLKNIAKKELIADYAFFLACYYVLLHEISHILLGHLNYLNDVMKLDYLSEFQDEKAQYGVKELKIRKAFEAEADRQSGELLMIFYEQSLGKDGLGGYLLFPSRLHAYEFYIYAITSVFRVLQDLTQREGVIHPKPAERLFIMLASLSKYFQQNMLDQHDEIYLHAFKSCLEAGKKFWVVESFEPLDVIKNARNLSFVDDVVRDINIRNYQHHIEVQML